MRWGEIYRFLHINHFQKKTDSVRVQYIYLLNLNSRALKVKILLSIQRTLKQSWNPKNDVLTKLILYNTASLLINTYPSHHYQVFKVSSIFSKCHLESSNYLSTLPQSSFSRVLPTEIRLALSKLSPEIGVCHTQRMSTREVTSKCHSVYLVIYFRLRETVF